MGDSFIVFKLNVDKIKINVPNINIFNYYYEE